MRLLRPASPAQIDLGLFLLRFILGTVFIAHGAQKIFVFGFDGLAAGFAQSGIPLAGLLAPLVALGELFGGLALVLGLLTRVAATGLAIIMVGAIFSVHLSGGFFLPAGYEFVLTLMLVAAALAITGAGSMSVDARLGDRLGVTRR